MSIPRRQGTQDRRRPPSQRKNAGFIRHTPDSSGQDDPVRHAIHSRSRRHVDDPGDVLSGGAADEPPCRGLIAATFTAFAPICWLIRDAKMYMHLWFACTMSVACMIWWMHCAKPEHGGQPGQRIYRRIAWLGWLASSIAMAGLHATGLAILGLEVIFLVTHLSLHPRQWRHFAASPDFPCWRSPHQDGWCTGWCSRQLDDLLENDWNDLGIGWVVYYNRERGGADLISFTASLCVQLGVAYKIKH